MPSIQDTASRGGDRVSLWDNLKLFLILMVVIGHFVDQYSSDSFKSIFLFIYSFHMPLFFFISGLFHRNRRIRQKVSAYFMIYVLLRAVQLIADAAFRRDVSFQLFSTSSTPWFMFVLAAFVGLTYLLRDIDKRLVLGVSIVLACLAGYDSSIGDRFFLSRLIVFFPFYHLGTMIPRDRLESLNRRTSLRIAGALIVLAWLAACFLCLPRLYFLRPLLTGRNPFGEAIYGRGWLFRLECYALSSLLGFALILAAPSRPLGVLTLCGQRTLQIYFWHRPILSILTYLDWNTSACATRSGKLLWLLLAVLLTFLLSFRLFSFPTDRILRITRPSAEAGRENSVHTDPQ